MLVPNFATANSDVAVYKKGYSGFDRDSYNNKYFSLHPELEIVGPVLDMTGAYSENYEWELRQKYTAAVYGALITSAHQWTLRYKDDFFTNKGYAKDAYWAFLLAAISVPHHESNLVHFAKRLAKQCSDFRNTTEWMNPKHSHIRDTKQWVLNKRGERQLKITESAEEKKEILSDFYYVKNGPVFPECKYLNHTDFVKQLLVSNADAGVMQINLDQHKSMREPDALLNVYRHIEYILKGWIDEFPTLYKERHSKYYVLSEDGTGEIECSLESTPYLFRGGTQSSSILGLVQGLWGGKHNTGNTDVDSICRFQYGNDSRKRDEHFRFQTLYPILDLSELVQHHENNNGEIVKRRFISIYDTYLVKGTPEYKSFMEIRNTIAAFHKTPGTKKALIPEAQISLFNKYKEIIQDSGIAIETQNLTGPMKQGNYYLNGKELPLYFAPSEQRPLQCGIVQPEEGQYFLVNAKEDDIIHTEVKLPSGESIAESWVKIKIPALREYRFKRHKNTPINCDTDEFYALASVGKTKILEAVGESEAKPKFFVDLDPKKISYSLTARAEPTTDSKDLGKIIRGKSPIGGYPVLKQYRSPVQTQYPVWYLIEFKPGKKAWFAASFLMEVN